MTFFKNFKLILKKVVDWLDDSPTSLCLSGDEVLKEKIKTILEKYALYDEVNAADYTFNGFGLFAVEFLGQETDLEKFSLILRKTVFDYLRLYYLDFTKTEINTQKIGDNIYVVNIYYSFSRKTLKNFEL